MPQKEKEDLIVDGERLDGRKPEDMREINIEVGLLESPEGSALVELGDTRVLAAVEGPKELHPQHLQKPDRAVLQAKYNMAPFSVDDRMSPKPSRRSKEISMVTRKALEPVIELERFPESVIKVHIEVLEADASTRVTGITAAGIALADAGIPMHGLVQACAVGKLEDTMVLDVAGEEDAYGKGDIPIATINGDIDEVTLLQMDGDVSVEEMEEVLDLAEKGNKKLYEAQKDALKGKFEGGE
ncbi:MAG: exosome complex exonuclease Rrp41 [Candidatus Nanohaloarchaeota archaeon QJJ-9]|nr:exosome complex exonuclease Rrp41 [Candidatus Nanohaloarchaeota archaeon QJJ-9]